MTQPKYIVILESAAGEWLEVDFYSSLTFAYALNSGATATLAMPASKASLTPALTATRNSYLKIYRQANPNQEVRLVWYGQAVTPSISGDENKATFTMTYETIFNLLAHRRTEADYELNTPTDAGQIVWSQIDATQLKTGGSLGIVEGSIPTSVNRTPKTELADRSIKEIVESYSSMENGFDFEITPTPKNSGIGIFNTYYGGVDATYHKGTVQATPLIYKVSSTGKNTANNVKSFQLTEEGHKFANFIRMTGATTGSTSILSEVSEANSLTAYGLYEDSLTNNDVQTIADLDARAIEEVRTRSTIPLQISFDLLPNSEPAFGTYDVGDIFPVDFEIYSVRSFRTEMRLYEMSVSLQNGVENISLSLNTI